MPKHRWKRTRIDELDAFPTVDRHWKRARQTPLASVLCRDQAFVAARAIYDRNDLIRFELEARILADQPQADIAAKMKFPNDVMAEFEYWFFDVRECLDMTSWIAHEAIRRNPTGELAVGEIGPFFRWVGYAYGPLILEKLLQAVDAETLQNKGIDAYLERGVPLDPEFKVLILIERLATPETPKEWNRFHRCRRAMSIAAVPQSGDLLSPFKTECWAFSEVAVEATEYEEIEDVDLLCELINSYLGKSTRVVQSQAA